MTTAPVVGERRPVAVAPDAGEVVEVARAVALAVGVVPEAHGHRRQRRGEDELADLVAQRPAALVEDVDRRAQAAALDLARTHGQQRAAADEGRADVGAAARGDRPHVLADRVVDPVEGLGRQRRAGRGDRAQGAEVVPARRGRGRPSRRRSGSRRSCRAPSRRSRRDRELGVELGMARAAVVEHDRRARPAGRRRASSRSSSSSWCRRRSGRPGRGRGAARGGGRGRAAGRRGRGRSPWAARWSPTRRARRAGGRRGAARTRAAPATPPGPPTARRPAARRGRAAATMTTGVRRVVERAGDLGDGGAPVVGAPAVAVAVARRSAPPGAAGRSDPARPRAARSGAHDDQIAPTLAHAR